jgi:ribonuclease-3
MTKPKLEDLTQILGYRFKNLYLLKIALTHRSANKEHNERLEFLGDAVLGLVIAHALFQAHPQATEGELSHTRAHLVCETSLAQLAQALQIGKYLRLGSGEMKQSGERRPTILADAMEAVIGAIYLDGGLSPCETCILNWYAKDLEQLTTMIPHKDPKTRLQEYLQANKHPLPHYRLVRQMGSAHQPEFEIRCELPDYFNLPNHLCIAIAKNRRQAEQQAAAQVFDYLQKFSFEKSQCLS